MKKTIISGIVVTSLLSIANAQTSGILIGVNVGLPITTPSYSGFLQTIKSTLPTSGIGWALSVDVGYKQALSEKLGLKYYLEYHYNQSYGNSEGGTNLFGISKVSADISQHLITANVDFYYEFIKSFGAYIGIGIGYQTFKPNWKPTITAGQNSTEITIGGETKGFVAVPLNLGLTYNFNDAHQILLGAKIPLVSYTYDTNVALQATTSLPGSSNLRTYIVQLGYNLVF